MSKKNEFYNKILSLEERILKNIRSMEFSILARECLLSTDMSSFDGLQTFKDCLPLTKNVEQYYRPERFGKFNLTLVSNPHFFIIVMYMDSIGTEIHDHPFTGAFMPLRGEPYEFKFQFHLEDTVTDFVHYGRLETKQIQKMSPTAVSELRQDTIHMIIRPKGGQFSILIGQSMKGYKNHYYLNPSHRIQNRPGSLLPARLALLQQLEGTIDLDLFNLLELDEKFELLLKQRSSSSLVTQVENILIKDPMIWNVFQNHKKFMIQTEQKLRFLT